MKISKDNKGMYDVCLNLLLGFIVLFFISLMMIQVKDRDADIKTKAEFVIILTWDEKSDHDIDLWLQNPNDQIIFYKWKEVDIMHLDRDDRGWLTDTVDTHKMGKRKVVHINQEMMTIRGFISGEWVLNLHLYRTGQSPGERLPVTANVQITKLNPVARIILNKKIKMTKYWEEVTVARFTMAGNGEILEIDDKFPKQLVETRITRGGTLVTTPSGNPIRPPPGSRRAGPNPTAIDPATP